MSHSNSASAGSNAGAGVGSFVGGLFNPTTTPNNAGVVTGGQQVDPISVISGITDYPAAFITGILGGDTSHDATGTPVTNPPIVQAGADAGSGVNQTVSQGVNSVTSWLAQNAIVIAVVAGAALVGVIAITSMFNNSSEGGTTHIVPVPV